ncbi:MAG TPA: hypothetical protein VF913_13600 [Xanthobacteraceae bacterium]
MLIALLAPILTVAAGILANRPKQPERQERQEREDKPRKYEVDVKLGPVAGGNCKPAMLVWHPAPASS